MKTAAIIQVRMKSSRLPGKALLPLANKPCLWWTITRCCLSDNVDEVIIATTSDPSNDPIEEFYKKYDISFSKPVTLFRYAGDENNIPQRVLEAAESSNVDIIVEVTNDCPMVSPAHINYLVDMFKKQFVYINYLANCLERSWPDGLDIQVYFTKSLRRMIQLFRPKNHCGWNFTEHMDTFSCKNIPAPEMYHWPELGLTLDTYEDYQLLKILFQRFSANANFSFSPEQVILYLKEHPELVEINSKTKRKIPGEG